MAAGDPIDLTGKTSTPYIENFQLLVGANLCLKVTIQDSAEAVSRFERIYVRFDTNDGKFSVDANTHGVAITGNVEVIDADQTIEIMRKPGMSGQQRLKWPDAFYIASATGSTTGTLRCE